MVLGELNQSYREALVKALQEAAVRYCGKAEGIEKHKSVWRSEKQLARYKRSVGTQQTSSMLLLLLCPTCYRMNLYEAISRNDSRSHLSGCLSVNAPKAMLCPKPSLPHMTQKQF